MNPRRLSVATTVGALLVAAMMVGASGAASPASAATGASPATVAAPVVAVSPAPTSVGASAAGRVIVRLGTASPQTVAAAAIRAGGRVVAVQAGLGTVVLDLPAGAAAATAAAAVAAVPGVLGVAADRKVHPSSLGFDPASQPGSMTAITRLTGAQALWRSGITGAGVDVALIDTGIAPVAGLNDPTKVVVGPDLSVDSPAKNLRHLDAYGHGTHMAGIIAGREGPRLTGSQYAASDTNFYGMAPDARLVSVKVAASDGAVDVSQLIAAIDWVVQHRNTERLNVRVLNLSLGTESTQDPAVDPLSWATENAWHAGIVVVASAGNSGGRLAGLDDPASNPWVIAVGATDAQGTDSYSDDVVPSFSARPTAAGSREVDLVAPGVKVVAPGVGGSKLYSSSSGSAKVGDGFLRGTGTSQAAAVVSGAVALILAQRPGLNPDQVKQILRSSATRLPNADPAGQGMGQLDLRTAVNWWVPRRAGQRLPWGSGGGSLERARGGSHLVLDGVVLTGEQDIFGKPWDSALLAAAARYDAAWSDVAWSPDGWFNGSNWTGAGFAADTSNAAGQTWSGRTWAGSTWSGSTWSRSTWSGATWSGRTWAGSTWAGSTWAGSTWTGSTWTGSTWAGSTWSGSTWAGSTWSGEVWQGKKWS